MTDNQLPSIPDFYSGKRIFVTGATGFLGKALTEKLLRSCPDVHTIYVLMRDKKKQDPKYRLHKFLQDQVFDRVRADQPNALSKIVIIIGNLTSEKLGISEADQQILEDKVSIVFHMAATVRFDEPLKEAARINISGTQKIVELCHRIKNLEAFIHVSTAYCNCNRKEIEEIVYDPPVHPDQLLSTLEWMDEKLVEQITPALLHGRPNTYTYTKTLAETVVMEKGQGLPMAIFRPAIVTAAWKEPFPGWIDNFNGAGGVFVFIGKGILRSAYFPERTADVVTVDVVANEAIAVAWYTACYKPNSTIVYNCSLGYKNKCYWKFIGEKAADVFKRNPYHGSFLYPSLISTNSERLNAILTFFIMIVPFYFFDFLSILRGRKPKLVSLYRKLDTQIKAMWYFVTNEWIFRNDNTLKLFEKLSAADKKEFNFDTTTLHWPTYFEISMNETRRFLLKEDFSCVQEDRKKNKRLYIGIKIVQGLTLYILWKTLSGMLSRVFPMSLLIGMYKSGMSMFKSFL